MQQFMLGKKFSEDGEIIPIIVDGGVRYEVGLQIERASCAAANQKGQ